MEQHPVPQNVTTFQFRLIGDMTLRQFGYLAAGALVAYVCYKLPLPFVFTWPLTMLSLLAGFGFAFVPVEERPMDVWVLSFFKSVYSPTQYLWQRAKPAAEPPPPGAVPAAAKAVTSTQAPVPTVTKTTVVSAPSLPAFKPAGVPSAATTPAAAPALPSKRRLRIFAWLRQLWRAQPKTTAPAAPGPKLAPAPTIAPAPPVAPPQPASAPKATAPSIKPPAQPKPPVAPPQPPRLRRRPTDPLAWFKDWFQPRPMAPVIQTKQYADVFAGAPHPGSITGKRLDIPTAPGTTPVAPISQPQHKLVTEAQDKITSLEDKLSQLQKELQTKSMTEARLIELQQQLTELLSQRNKMEQELMDMRRKLSVQPAARAAVRPAAAATPTLGQPTVKVITAEGAFRAGLPRLTTFPNVVTGIIKDGENNQLPGVLVTVRDKEDMPLRALKTNKLGQFAASTPLPNGTYFMEVEDPRDRFVFDRIQIALNGTILPAIEIVAKSQKELTRQRLEKEIFGAPKM